MATAAPHADRPLRALLAELAAPTPSPAAGSALGWSLALACGLAEQSAGIAGFGDERTRAAALQAEALLLAEDELTAYAPVLDALGLPDDEPARPRALHDAFIAASRAPAAIAAAAAEVEALCRELAVRGRPALRGDALAGADLAAGARAGGERLVALNHAAAGDLG